MSDQDSVLRSEVGQISDVDDSLSDEEYIPDSQADDSDTSIPFMSCKPRDWQATDKTGMPDEEKSYGSDTDIQVWPSTSKDPPPLEDNVIPKPASHLGTSTKGASKENQRMKHSFSITSQYNWLQP